jgi:microsomal dipeptidase-like Zn-dependent dipeptidase
LKLAEARNVPVVASHVGATLQGRSLGDEQAKRILALGGLIGVGVYHHPMLAPVPENERAFGHTPGSCDDVISHWVHYTALGSAEQVMLGSDFSSLAQRPPAGGACPSGIRNAGDLPELFGGLLDRGIAPSALSGSADRVIAVLEKAEAIASQQQRRSATQGLRRGSCWEEVPQWP